MKVRSDLAVSTVPSDETHKGRTVVVAYMSPFGGAGIYMTPQEATALSTALLHEVKKQQAANGVVKQQRGGMRHEDAANLHVERAVRALRTLAYPTRDAGPHVSPPVALDLQIDYRPPNQNIGHATFALKFTNGTMLAGALEQLHVRLPGER